MQDLSSYRQDFPALQGKGGALSSIYLDTAATAHKPQKVIQALCDFYAKHYATVHRAIYARSQAATEQYCQVRKQVQGFLGAAKQEEIVFTKGTTESINLVAQSFGKAFLRPGDEVLVPEIEHHSNLVPWQMACHAQGAKLRPIPVTDAGEIDLEGYARLLSDKTRLVAVAHVSNVLGTVHPVRKMIAMAHAVDAKVLVDGAQAVPHHAVDVQQLDADFYAFSGHKIYGPTGIGVLYGKEGLLDAMPPFLGGGDMIEMVTFDKTTYQALPLKFEAGTPPIAEVIGLGAALDYVGDVGLEVIAAWEGNLVQYAVESLGAIKGVRLLGAPRERASLVSFVVEDVHHLDVGSFLDLRGISVRTGHLCAQPAMQRFGIPGVVRASFGLYNTRRDVEALMEGIEAGVALYRGV